MERLDTQIATYHKLIDVGPLISQELHGMHEATKGEFMALVNANPVVVTSDRPRLAEMKQAADKALWSAVKLRVALEESVIQPAGECRGRSTGSIVGSRADLRRRASEKRAKAPLINKPYQFQHPRRFWIGQDWATERYLTETNRDNVGHRFSKANLVNHEGRDRRQTEPATTSNAAFGSHGVPA